MRETHLEGYALDRYEIREFIDEGGFGEVYRAWATDLRIEVAVKVLKPSQARFPGNVERFADEAYHMARLNHPHLVHIYSYGNCVGWHYIAMRLLEGTTLEAALEGHTGLPLPRVVKIVGEIAAGLDNAHARGRVHRDVKPANIFLTPDGAVLTDFGLAKQLDRTPVTVTQTIAGTPPYMAPEQITGQGISLRTDIYGLALVAYEALTGYPAYPASPDGNPWPTLKAKLEQDLPPLRLDSASPAVVEQVDAVLRTAAARVSEVRYASAGEFAKELEKACVEPASPPPLPPRSKDNRGLLVALGVLGIALVVVLAILLARPILGVGLTPAEATETAVALLAPAEQTLAAMRAEIARATDDAATRSAASGAVEATSVADEAARQATAAAQQTEAVAAQNAAAETAAAQAAGAAVARQTDAARQATAVVVQQTGEAASQATAAAQAEATRLASITDVVFFEENHRFQTDFILDEGQECAGFRWEVQGQPTDCVFQRLGYGNGIAVDCSNGSTESLPQVDKCFATMLDGSKEKTMQYRFLFSLPDGTRVSRGVDVHRNEDS